MEIALTTTFLSLSFVVSFQAFMAVASPGLVPYGLFFYYIVTKARYYQGDLQLSRQSPKAIRKGERTQQVLNLFFGVGVQFLFLVCARFVAEPEDFFTWYAITLLCNLAWLGFSGLLFDKSNQDSKILLQTFKRWAVVNILEFLLSLTTALYLIFHKDLVITAPSIAAKFTPDGILLWCLIFLFVLALIDMLWNREFLFPD